MLGNSKGENTKDTKDDVPRARILMASDRPAGHSV
jgi:hypothetical protein